MNNHILVSVIIPFYSGKECLNSALESVFNQTHKKIEVILINDGSREKLF
jgi:glycosyltransferase involved in cell wall biosynthesis